MRPRLCIDVTFRPLPDGEAAVLGADEQQVVILNAMGVVVWELCDGRRSIAEIAAVIDGHTSGGALSQIERDVAELVAALRDAGFVEDGEP